MNRVAAANYLGDENQGGALDTPFNPIDNPDARIVNDVQAFTKNLVSMLPRFVIGCCSLVPGYIIPNPPIYIYLSVGGY